MPEADLQVVERIIANTINETARGDPDALAARIVTALGEAGYGILPANGMEDTSPGDQSFDELKQLYRSPNGDIWSLAHDHATGTAFVRHQANAPSGGHVTDLELGAFLVGRRLLPSPAPERGPLPDLLGAAWLVMKTTGDLKRQARRFAIVSGAGTIALIGVVSLWTPFLNPVFMSRWFAFPAILYALPVPLAVAGMTLLLFRGLRAERDAQPFIAALGLFVLCYVGLGISLYPEIVPPSITIWQAAAPDKSLEFLLIGTLILVPIIVAYMAHAYWVFRGKVDVAGGYHE